MMFRKKGQRWLKMKSLMRNVIGKPKKGPKYNVEV